MAVFKLANIERLAPEVARAIQSLKIYVDNKVPRGFVASGTATANQAGITVAADITGLTVTWTSDASRRYRINGKVEVIATAADGAFVIALTDSGGTAVQRATDACLTTSSRTATITHYENGTGASITRKMRLSKEGGTGSLTAGSDALFPAWLTVEDIGPV